MLSFRKPKPALFGKLPIAGDFLSFGEIKGTAAEWTGFLNAAFSSVDTTAPSQFSRKVYRFWYRGERERMLKTPVGGYLADSHDRVGRRFPYSVFTNSPNSASSCVDALKAAAPAWRVLAEPFDRSRSFAGIEEMYQYVDHVDLQKSLDREGAKTPSCDVSIQDLIDGVGRGVEQNLCAILGRLRRHFEFDADAIARAGIVVRIPINSGYSAIGQAMFWASVLDGRPGGSKSDCPNIILPGSPRSDDPILFFFRDLSANDAANFFADESAFERAFDLCDVLKSPAQDEDVEVGKKILVNLGSSIQDLDHNAASFWKQ